MARGQKLATAFLELAVDDQRMQQGLRRQRAKLKEGFQQLGQAAAAGFAAFGINKLLSFGEQAAREAEVAKIGFEVLTGSAEKGRKVFEELRGFSDVTPFEGDEVRKAGKKLLASGNDASVLTEKLQFLGDAAAAVDANFNEVVSIFAKIQNQGKLTGETFEQLAERSINVQPMIQQQLGITADQFLKMRAAGEITAVDVENALKAMSSEGGAFFGSMDKLSQTLDGRMSTLRTRFKQVAEAIGTQLMPMKKRFVEVAIKLLDIFLKLDPSMQKVIGTMAGIAPVAFAAAAALRTMQAAGIGAGFAIRTALAATGIGILLPLIGFVISKFLNLGEMMGSSGDIGKSFAWMGGAIKKLNRAWVVFFDAVKKIGQIFVRTFKTLFGDFFARFGIDLSNMKEDFMGMIMFLVDLAAEFVLDLAEWFNVIVTNWDTVTAAVTTAWKLFISRSQDIFSNFLSAALTASGAFVDAFTDLFSNVPRILKAAITGGLKGVQFELANQAVQTALKFNQSLNKAFGELTDKSALTRQLEKELSGQVGALLNAKAELERERDQVNEFDPNDLGEAKNNAIDKKGKGKKEGEAIKVEIGETSLAGFASEIQDFFLDEGETEKDLQKKVVKGIEDQTKIDRDNLGVNKDIRTLLAAAPPIRVAGN